MGITKLPGGKFRLQIRQKHLQVDESYATREAAEAAEAAHLSLKSQDWRGMTLNQLWPRYTESIGFLKKESKTQSTERGRIKPVLEKLGNYLFTELEADVSIVEDYRDMRLMHKSPRTAKLMSDTSVRLELAALVCLVKFAKRRKIINTNFMMHVERPAPGQRKRRVSPKEQGSMTIYSRNSDPEVSKAARFQMLIRHLGCRPGELMQLLVSNISLEQRELTFMKTKNGTDRCIHITSDAETMINLQLAELPEDSPYLFPTWSPYKKCWVPYNYAKGVNRLRELGIVEEDYHAHAGRREFVSRAIEAGVPLLTIKKLTGHKSTQALEIYDQGKATSPDIREAMDKLAALVKSEGLMGAFEAAGLTPEQKRKMLAQLGQDGTKSPFPGVTYKG